MSPDDLARSARSDSSPPNGLSLELTALWHARAGRWDAAHDLCQHISGPAGAWIHAYLHREEGDLGNAAYWYSMAGKPVPASNVSLDEEWRRLVAAMVPPGEMAGP